tara:strand:- start:457 stop:624 length:168 start_codon:yes stop_codon:yes gene_type:complete
MLELLQLAQAGLTITAVTITVVAAPAAIMTGTELPSISPLLEIYDDQEVLEKNPN